MLKAINSVQMFFKTKNLISIESNYVNTNSIRILKKIVFL